MLDRKLSSSLRNLILWLEDRIIETKTQNTSIQCIDPKEERSALDTPTIQERIENTARIFADRVWKRFRDDWSQRFPLVVAQEDLRRRPKSRLWLPKESPGVKTQHDSPSFSNEYWADGLGKQIRVYFRGVDEGVSSRDQGYRGRILAGVIE